MRRQLKRNIRKTKDMCQDRPNARASIHTDKKTLLSNEHRQQRLFR